MTVLRKVACQVVVSSTLIFPAALAAEQAAPAQAPPAQTAGIPQTDAQKRGEALFLSRCPLCHVHSNQKKTLGIQANTELIGLFKGGAVDEDAVRKLILTGLPRMMPSFQYTLDAKQIDDLIAYLKIR